MSITSVFRHRHVPISRRSSPALQRYGYNWATSGGSNSSVVNEEAIALATQQGATITRDGNFEATFSYNNHILYFQDAVSYQKKVDSILQNHPLIAGFAHWRTG